MRIGFDFDKIFINTPPLIPVSVIDYFFRHGLTFSYRDERALTYRIPGSVESKIRIASHLPFLRPPIKKNISVLHRLHQEKKHNLILVSSRFAFLKKMTFSLIKKYGLSTYFEKMYFNFQNEQPHIFKERVLREERIRVYVDDDIDLIEYLSKKLPNVSFFWITENRWHSSSRITPVPDLQTFYNKYLKQNGN